MMVGGSRGYKWIPVPPCKRVNIGTKTRDSSGYFRLIKQRHNRVRSRPRRWRDVLLRPAVAVQIVRGGSIDQRAQTVPDELNRLGILCSKREQQLLTHNLPLVAGL